MEYYIVFQNKYKFFYIYEITLKKYVDTEFTWNNAHLI